MILDESLFENTTNNKVVVHLLPDEAQASYGSDYWEWMLDDDGLYGVDGKNGIVIMDSRGDSIIHNYTPYSNKEILDGNGSIEETLTSLTGKTYKEFTSTGYSQGDYFVCYYPEGEFSEEWLLTIANTALGMYEIYEIQGNENGDYTTQINDTVIVYDSLNADVKHQIADIIGAEPQDIIIKKPIQRWDYEELDESLFEQTPTLEESLQESIDWYGGVQEITRKDYQHFLNCLPPAEPLEQVQGYTGQFLVGEPFMTDDNGHELFSHFGKKGGKYYFLGNHRAKRGSYIGDSEADQDAYYNSMNESVEQPPLWDGKYRPEDITPEYVRKLDMPTSLKLLRWFDKWAEHNKQSITESASNDKVTRYGVYDRELNNEGYFDTKEEAIKVCKEEGLDSVMAEDFYVDENGEIGSYIGSEIIFNNIKESVEGDQIAQDTIDSKNANYEADKETTREVRKELARQGIATDENGTPLTESVNWGYFDKFDEVIADQMGPMGEGETMSSQIVTAVNKLIYKYYNDGDVYDNRYGLQGWANDLSSYANWLYNNVPETKNILLKIRDIKLESNYEDLLKELADLTLNFDFLFGKDYNAKEKVGSIYNEKGPFKYVEPSFYDDEDYDNYDEEDYFENYNIKSRLLKESAEDCAKAMREQDPLVMNLAMGFAKGNGHILDQVSKGEKTLEQVIEEVSAQSNFLTKEMWDTVIRCAMFCDRGKSLKEDTSAKAYAKKLGQDDIQYFTKKNQFNYDVKQVRIDNTNKTYEFGAFKITSGRESTKNGREFDRLIDKLKELGYTEIKKNIKESAQEEYTIEINNEIYCDDNGNAYHFDSYEEAQEFIEENELQNAQVTRQHGKAMYEDINQDTFTDNGLASIINTLIQDEFDAIQQYNDAIVNFETEGRQDLVQVLHDILNEENLHVGQLETLLEQVSGSANSIDRGKAEAETQLNVTTLGESYGDEKYFPYNPELGWTEEDIALHKSIDWKERNYRDYEVAEDSFKGKVYAYGKDIDDKKLYTFHKFIRSNSIFPPYYKAVDFKDGSLVGPMYDGRTHKTYNVHDRYETQEIYDRLSN